MTHIVTEGLLQDNINCQSKSYLRLHGRSGQVSDYAALCSRLDARHLASASQWLAAQSMIGGVSRFDGTRLEDKVHSRRDDSDAVGATDGLETHFHAIERMPGDLQLGPFHYRPIRFCRSLQPRSAVHLLLAFDAFILGRLQGVCPDVGILFCGPTFRRIRVFLRTHLDSLTTILARLRAQSASDHEPPLLLNRHCDICEFNQLCRVKAVDADNLTLLKGMTPMLCIRIRRASSRSNSFLTRSARDGRRGGKSNSSIATLRSRRTRSAKRRSMCSVTQTRHFQERKCIWI